MTIYQLKEKTPKIDPSVYIAPTAIVIGDVTIGKNSSIWFHCVLRSDADAIIIGDNTNIQDLTVCHQDPGKPLRIGNHVTVGHRCVVHGCTIEDYCLIGMGSIVMNGVKIGLGSIVAAGSVVLEDTIIPPLSMVAGVPAKIKKTFDKEVIQIIKLPADVYVDKAKTYLETLVETQ